MCNHIARISVIIANQQSWIKDDDVIMFVIDDIPWSAIKLFKPLGWLLHGPLEAVVAVDVDEAETSGVAASPLEVVHQRPGKVATHVRTWTAVQMHKSILIVVCVCMELSVWTAKQMKVALGLALIVNYSIDFLMAEMWRWR